MSQKNGKKMPIINMTQCPFLIVRTPRVTISIEDYSGVPRTLKGAAVGGVSDAVLCRR